MGKNAISARVCKSTWKVGSWWKIREYLYVGDIYGSVSKLVKHFCLKNFLKVEFSNHIYGLNFLKSQISSSCLVT